MEKISDFFSELKERISNPFILSYIIAWCIWNYQIVVGLLFYKINELKIDGYNSYLDLILCYSNTWHFFWLPFFSALIYTFLFPFIKNLILAFGTWIDTWGNNWILNISKTKKVSSEKYLKYKIQYEDAIEKISKFANDEQIFNNKLSDYQKEKNAALEALGKLNIEVDESNKFHAAQLEQAKKEVSIWQHVNSVNFLEGEWYLKISEMTITKLGQRSESKVEYNVKVNAGEMIMTKQDRSTENRYVFNITCNFIYMIIYLSKVRDNSIDDIWTFTLQNKNTQILKGKDSQGMNIELRKTVEIRQPQNQ